LTSQPGVAVDPVAEKFMRHLLNALLMISTAFLAGTQAHAQQAIALKNGESAELGTVWWVVNCRSIMVGMPEVEILEGLPGLTLSIKEAMVLPRRLNCANQVPGGILVATAKDVSDPVQGTLIYRIKYKTKDGDRQVSNTYKVSLFP
jgi:hypothetical protein